MEIKTDITKRDLVEFQLFQLLRCRDARAWWMAAALLPPLALISLINQLLRLFLPSHPHISTMLVPIALVLPFYLLLLFRVSRLLLAWQMDHSVGASGYQAALGQRLLFINERGIAIEHQSRRAFHPWEHIIRVVANGDYGYAYTSSNRAVIIPRHSFNNGDEVSFRAFMQAAIVFHWEKELATKAAAEARSADAAAGAKAERQALEPDLNLEMADTSKASSFDTQWSKVALKNVKPSEVGAENAWLG